MDYFDKANEFIVHKTNVGDIKNPSITAKNQGTCCDILILHLKIMNDTILDAKYEYIGCAGLQAAASALTKFIIGKNLAEVSNIETKKILEYLYGLPQQKHKCTLLASTTLKKALDQYNSDFAKN
jgi:nitrogen fixation NifU-like protein